MSDDDDQSENYDSYDESDHSGAEEEEETSKDPSRDQYSLMNEIVGRIDAATKRAAAESGEDRDKLIIAGDFLLNDFRELNPVSSDQEEVLIKWMTLIRRIVEAHSDHQESFWEASHFFQLVIETYSYKTVVATVKACVAIYNTEHTSDNVVIGWALAASKRCAQWIKINRPEDLLDPESLKTIKSAKTILRAVGEAGYEFEEVIKADADLKDALAELNLLLAQASTSSSVFQSVNAEAIATIKKEVVQIEALSSDSAEGVITALEQSVDLANPSGTPLFEAYNAMCDEQPADLELQVHAAQGPLAKLAVQALFQQNEHKQGKKHLFLEALVFCKMLLQPWDRADAAHMEAKLQIATSLLELDIVTALLGQFNFWVEHKFGYGDCGDPALLAFLELARYFPNIINDHVLPDTNAVTFIRHVAEVERNNRTGRSRFSGGCAAVVLEALLEGKPEPPSTVTKRREYKRPGDYPSSSRGSNN